MKPTIGRIVLYQAHTDKTRGRVIWPAMITEVRQSANIGEPEEARYNVCLTVFGPSTLAFVEVRFGNEDGTWRWPERVS